LTYVKVKIEDRGPFWDSVCMQKNACMHTAHKWGQHIHKYSRIYMAKCTVYANNMSVSRHQTCRQYCM